MAQPADLQLKAVVTLDWRGSDLAAASYRAAVEFAEQVLHTAETLAKQNVAVGVGPGPHPHREDHNFTWEDTGKLQAAIRIDRTASGKLRVATGMAGGTLVVDPIDYGDGRGPLPTGVWLEFGFIPVFQSLVGEIDGHKVYQTERGYFTRYPFLGPAIAEATKDIPTRAKTMVREAIDLAAKRRKKASIERRAAIDGPSNLPINKFNNDLYWLRQQIWREQQRLHALRRAAMERDPNRGPNY